MLHAHVMAAHNEMLPIRSSVNPLLDVIYADELPVSGSTGTSLM
jgi:hypothetical protein